MEVQLHLLMSSGNAYPIGSQCQGLICLYLLLQKIMPLNDRN